MSADRDMAKAIGLAQSGKLKPAIAIMDGVVRQNPGSVNARYNLALFLLMAGRHAEALPHLDRILASDPRHQAALFSKAKGLMALDRTEEALPLLTQLSATADPESLLALGNAYRILGRNAEAAETYRRLTRAAPGLAGAHLNLGMLLSSWQPEEAVTALQLAVSLHPKSPELHALLGQTRLRLGMLDEAIQSLKTAIALAPDLSTPKGHLLRAYRESALWDEEESLLAELRQALKTPLPKGQLVLATQDSLFYPLTGAERLALAKAEAAFRVPVAPRPLTRPQPKAPPPLVVGYLSPDFRDHATMHLAGDVFRHHDRAKVRPLAYSLGPDDGSEWRRRVARECDGFMDLSGLSDRAAATRMAEHGVHILVDMSVYTRHARPGIPALRPAPVQMAWLGLGASSGAPWIDYALVDAVLVPPAHGDHFSESLIRMPHSYQPNLAWSAPGPAPSRSSLGLPDDAVVFCSFNGHRKLDRASFMMWMEVLKAVPDSVLWQLEPPRPARERLCEVAKMAGVQPDRLIWAPQMDRASHLARIPAADLFLDALVCGAHTTAADALRMGVPLLSVPGETMAARVAASLLSVLELEELMPVCPEAFVAKAVELGMNRDRLRAIRSELAKRLPQSPVFSPQHFASGLELAYTQVWARHASGKKHADIVL